MGRKACFQITTIVITVIMLLSLQPVFAADTNTSITGYRMQPLREKLAVLTDADITKATERFFDVPKHWARIYIGKLTMLGIINGMPDGTFMPDNSVKVDEFIAMTVKALGYKPETGYKYWAQPYIDIGIEEKIIGEDEFLDYKRAITREEMTKVTVLAAMLKEPSPDSGLDNLIRMNIKDYTQIGDTYKQYVITAYRMGLINGAPDGTFNPKNSLTRGEASTVILKNLSEKDRTPFKPETGYAIELTDGNGKTYTVCKRDKAEEIKTAYVIKNNISKSKGYVHVIYNPDGDLIGVTFFESEQSAKENVYGMHMSLSIETNDNLEFPYAFTVNNPAKAKELHEDLAYEIFRELFEEDADKAMLQFNKYIEAAISKGKYIDENFSFNGRKVRIYKLDGDSAFSMWIYNKAN